MSFSLKFYGTSSAAPALARGFACIGLVSKEAEKEDIVLVDCGDGSVRQIIKTTSTLCISNVLITHFHSDHLSGLVQIIETMGIEKRERDLDLYGPAGLEDYVSLIQKITNVASKRKFEIHVHEIVGGDSFSIGSLKVNAYVMKHTVPALGYKITNGKWTVAYSGDTEPCDASLELAKDSNVLVHEATFLDADLAKARESKHSTPSEAAEIARRSRAVKLILTHVNDKYEDEKRMLLEAKKVHEETLVAYDGLEIEL
ncbi:MAG: ribonuclease Z [Nitrososphaerales archaeon]